MFEQNPEFLDDKYKDLTGSTPVERAVEKAKSDEERDFAPHTRIERIQAYLDRLDHIVEDEKGWEHLKNKIIKEFTIDTDGEETMTKIAHSLYESEKKIAIEQGRGNEIRPLESQNDLLEKYKEAVLEKKDVQSQTLSTWLDYLEQNDAEYPTWFRYFVVRNLSKMGSVNKERGDYSKRNEYTTAPFPELNGEALGYVYRMLTTGIGHQELNSPEDQSKRENLTKLIEKKDFPKLYAFAQIETAGQLNKESIQGEWVKYNQGSDHHVLEDALKGKGTGWCTASGSAYAHLQGGDFYVYYTKGVGGHYSEPRVAIRTDQGRVAEVRGVNHGQELEPELIDIAQEKYHSLPEGEKFDKKSEDMKKMTELTKKLENEVAFSKEDLRFIYEIDSEIEGFGYKKDPRIEKLKEVRNTVEDLNTIFEGIKHYEGNLILINLISAEGLKLPESIGGNLDFRNLTSAEGLKLPESIGGNLDLERLRSATDLKLPKSIGGNLDLGRLESVERLNLPESIGGNLDLGSIVSTDGIKLPEFVGGNLYLEGLTSLENLTLPDSVGGFVNFRYFAPGLKDNLRKKYPNLDIS